MQERRSILELHRKVVRLRLALYVGGGIMGLVGGVLLRVATLRDALGVAAICVSVILIDIATGGGE